MENGLASSGIIRQTYGPFRSALWIRNSALIVSLTVMVLGCALCDFVDLLICYEQPVLTNNTKSSLNTYHARIVQFVNLVSSTYLTIYC